jgi:hypothetical protein
MREEPLLTIAPASITTLPEFYAVAFHQAQLAAQHYGALAIRADKNLEALRPVFGALAERENTRADFIAQDCVKACGRTPDEKRLPPAFTELVPAQEISGIIESGLSTPYTLWALAVRHRRRAFVYWTYVSALTGDAAVRTAAERLAREALSDGGLLRRERRRAWQNEHGQSAEDSQGDRGASTALLESLLLRDVIAWSQTLPPEQRRQLLHVGAAAPGDHASIEDIETPAPDQIESVKQRAVRRAEQLSNAYLDEADHATDQSSLELAQKLAAHSITRFAGLRAAAKSS